MNKIKTIVLAATFAVFGLFSANAIDAIEFKETVHVGDWVSFEANIISTGKSSIVIKIDAYKESKEIEKTLACTARFTFVSVQKDQFGTYKKINHNQTI